MFKQLQDMALFALVAELGSFTAAAQKAELPKSSVSQRISQLEQQVGIRLLNRTTRRLNLTFAGEHYLVHCREMLAASERRSTPFSGCVKTPAVGCASPARPGSARRCWRI